MIHRIDVRTKLGTDAHADHVAKQAAELGLNTGNVTAGRVFFLDGDLSADDARAVATKLLADPVTESFDLVTATIPGSRVEVHLKPGVMDPVAASTEAALADLGYRAAVRTGRAYAFEKPLTQGDLKTLAARALANGVIESIHFDTHLPARFSAGTEQPFDIRHAELLNLDDDALKRLSRDGHLFLNLVEMKAVQDYFKTLNREPTDIELETIAQTWSEHCVHKTLKSSVDVCDAEGTVLRSYKNLIKETIFASTMELVGRADAPFCLSVFKDNAGVVVFDDTDAVCIKVETHNRPSAIEPYGGAATGIGGCIRDVLGTGLGARPIANTNVFCVAYPERGNEGQGMNDKGNALTPHVSSLTPLPKGVLHPKRVLQQVVAGVRDYGNRMGIPTVNGAVYFDENYVGNPLVFAGCVGVIPRTMIEKKVGRGDAIVVLGGRTGRDGIHGATFSSAELTTTHADEFSHAVQIGNAITQKQLMDVLLQARDRNLYTAVTDCGAGGLSSAIGEMGGEVGASVELEKITLKYAGLRYDEIWISEAQERMVLSVPPDDVDALLTLAKDENVEATVIGTFGTDGEELILSYRGTEVGRLAMAFLHDGIPMPKRKAVLSDERRATSDEAKSPLVARGSSLVARLLSALAHPNVASKHWIIRQYDHEVQGGTVIKPLVGSRQIGPSDASVIKPKPTGNKGVAVACGFAPAIQDPYEMALASIDEAVRNIVCVGSQLSTTAILDNFCWPGTDDEVTLGTLVRACEACRDAALAFGIPFISGKDSLHNQFTDKETNRVIKIPRTLLITALSVLDDVRRCVTMDLKAAGNVLVRVKPMHAHAPLAGRVLVHQTVADVIASGAVRSAHDVSDGGLLCCVAEMALASEFGVDFCSPTDASDDDLFAEPVATYVLELDAARRDEVMTRFARAGVAAESIGTVTSEPTLTINDADATPIAALRAAWRGTLDW